MQAAVQPYNTIQNKNKNNFYTPDTQINEKINTTINIDLQSKNQPTINPLTLVLSSASTPCSFCKVPVSFVDFSSTSASSFDTLVSASCS